MRSPNLFLTLAGLVSLAACGTSAAGRARDIAADRLHCPVELVTTTTSNGSPMMFTASGCGERVVCEYVRSSRFANGHIGNVAVRCTPVGDSQVATTH